MASRLEEIEQEINRLEEERAVEARRQIEADERRAEEEAKAYRARIRAEQEESDRQKQAKLAQALENIRIESLRQERIMAGEDVFTGEPRQLTCYVEALGQAGGYGVCQNYLEFYASEGQGGNICSQCQFGNENPSVKRFGIDRILKMARGMR